MPNCFECKSGVLVVFSVNCTDIVVYIGKTNEYIVGINGNEQVPAETVTIHIASKVFQNKQEAAQPY